ncbi:hypothetical protein Pmar_PMAR019070 [Perkinsus marinus ATCC 50983]|uniref:Uncharacterized protein n=1 Tax=Perkinsus marinus (strain ATCC 50983 / TXsc) TaxID=423536 RepID=C5KTS6_PERM5|nr:hypothetical protein Pmar_PMAR019070 [Perkinsus marinus ATCC 50983]EER11968.1 hypothetical protein Pmar_PMAR019070 [Perkinsus marinus ATCC 50983]|eukprot:XP_002780173.1 hypothetical protein Pmar_PMAR019070 [Perkinsus marinus ATCC 50983]
MVYFPIVSAALLVASARVDVLDVSCEAVCEGIPECSSRGTYCKDWHVPKACFGLYWSGGGKMCYQPADPSCPAEYPVLCDEVAPHAPKQDDHTVTTLPPSDTITSTTTMTMETMMWIESTTATTSLRYVASTSPPTEPTTMRTTTADVFNGAMDQAAVAAIMVAEETPYPSGPRGWYCGLLGGVISLSMYFEEDTFDIAGVSDEDIEGIPYVLFVRSYSLSASGCIIPDYRSPPFSKVLSVKGGGNPFYVVYDSSKGEIRGLVQGAKIIATPC